MLAVLVAVQLLALGGTVRLPALHVATEADAALACPANAALASAIGL
ncbi:MAG: hypothetical protein H6Q89_2947, partial [Myxococcaceae bacterium]|nr:hypothetical protein [Myxococcaceae bacterium]